MVRRAYHARQATHDLADRLKRAYGSDVSDVWIVASHRGVFTRPARIMVVFADGSTDLLSFAKARSTLAFIEAAKARAVTAPPRCSLCDSPLAVDGDCTNPDCGRWGGPDCPNHGPRGGDRCGSCQHYRLLHDVVEGVPCEVCPCEGWTEPIEVTR